MAIGNTAPAPSVSALDVAGMIVIAAEERGIKDLTTRKLQKLLYFTQLYQLGLHNEPAFSDQIKAWADGPVVPNVWHQFKDKFPASHSITRGDLLNLGAVKSAIQARGAVFETVLKVIHDFGQYGQNELIDLTHGQRPWLESWKGDPSISETMSMNTLTRFAPVLLRYSRPESTTVINLLAQTQAFFDAPGSYDFLKAKTRIADAAASLDQAMALAFDNEQIQDGRSKLADAIRDFSAKFGSKGGLDIDVLDPEMLDRFARALTDYSMEHRSR